MQIIVKEYDPKKYTAIREAVEKLWPTGDSDKGVAQGVQYAAFYGSGYLTGGETEKEFSCRVRDAVWTAAGRCAVEVVATCTEEMPHECYPYSVHDYDIDAVRLGIEKPAETP